MHTGFYQETCGLIQKVECRDLPNFKTSKWRQFLNFKNKTIRALDATGHFCNLEQSRHFPSRHQNSKGKAGRTAPNSNFSLIFFLLINDFYFEITADSLALVINRAESSDALFAPLHPMAASLQTYSAMSQRLWTLMKSGYMIFPSP